jgi:hypothetical protein
MRTINIYKFNELSNEAQKNAVTNCQNKFEIDLDFFIDDAKMQIVEQGFYGKIDLQYSFGNSFGDGLSFSCEYFDTKRLAKIFENILGERKQKTIDLIINNCNFNLFGNTGRYCYAHINDLEFIFDDNINAPNIIEVVKKVEDELKSIYVNLCKKLETDGYNEIEYQNSDEYTAELLEINEYEFLENGKMI